MYLVLGIKHVTVVTGTGNSSKIEFRCMTYFECQTLAVYFACQLRIGYEMQGFQRDFTAVLFLRVIAIGHVIHIFINILAHHIPRATA